MCKRYVLFMILVLTFVQLSSAGSKRVLIDFSHGERVADPLGASDGSPCFDIFGNMYEIIESRAEITYKNVQECDMILICQPRTAFEPSEIEVIARFVNNGGGVLLVASHAQSSTDDWSSSNLDLVPINSLSEVFGVEFITANELWVNNVIEIGNSNHPLLKSVKKVNSGCYGALVVGEPSKGLLYLEKQRKCIAAYCEYGKGRVVFLANSEFILHPYVDNLDNQQFIANVFSWLSEPGGPYLQQEYALSKGVTLMEKGKEQMDSHEYDSAKSTFVQSKNYFQSAFNIYEGDETVALIERVDSLIADTNTGIAAEAFYREGKRLYESSEFSSAISKLEEAQTLFQSISSLRSEDCVLLIQECKTKIQTGREGEVGELQEWADELLSEGIAFFEQQQYDRAQSKFEEALELFTETEDDEKVVQCNEWIASCEENLRQPVSFRMVVIILVVGAILVTVVIMASIRTHRPPPVTKKHPPPEGEELLEPPETDALKVLKDRFDKGEITAEEYEKIKSMLKKD